MQARGPKGRKMEGQMDGQILFYRNLPTTARFQKKNLQNRSRIKETCHFWPNWDQNGQKRILLDKKTMSLM